MLHADPMPDAAAAHSSSCPVFSDGGDQALRQALRDAAAALDSAERCGQPFAISQAWAELAHGHRALGATDVAETSLQQALRWARHAQSNDQVVDLLCELCETAAQLADNASADAFEHPGAGHAARERARDHAFEATTLAPRVADAGWEATVLLRISDVLDRCGDRDDAVLLQTRALRLMSGALAGGAPDPSLMPSLGRLADV